MVQPIALGVQNPQINALGAFREGAAAKAGLDASKREAAEKSLQLIGAASMHALGGDINGQADPGRFEEGLDMLESQGIDVSKFRGKPQMAAAAARASVSAIQQLQMAQDERQFELLMQKFGRDVMESDRTYELQKGKFEYLKGKEANEQAGAQSPLGKFKADLDAGLIDQATYDAAIKKATAESGGITVAPDGTVTIGGQLGKLTEGQSKDVNYYIRGRAALENVSKYEGALASFKDNALSKVPGGNYATSAEFQQANQAGREFLASILRKDTGAAITKQEFDIYGPMFLPQPGDGEEVLAQKRVARERAIEAIRTGLGAKGDALAPDEPAEEKRIEDMTDEELEAIVNGQ